MWEGPEKAMGRSPLCSSDRKREKSEEKRVIFLFANKERGHLQDVKDSKMGKVEEIL